MLKQICESTVSDYARRQPNHGDSAKRFILLKEVDFIAGEIGSRTVDAVAELEIVHFIEQFDRTFRVHVTLELNRHLPAYHRSNHPRNMSIASSWTLRTRLRSSSSAN